MYIFSVAALAAAILLAGCGAVSSPAISGAPAANSGPVSAEQNTARLKKVQIIDSFFGMPAATLTIPDDWVFEGTVLRAPNNPADGEIVFRASSRDGLSGVQRLPRYDSYWSNAPFMVNSWKAKKLLVMQPVPAGDFLTKVVLPEARPGAEVINTEPLPDSSAQLAEKDEKTNAQFAAAAAPLRTTPMHMTSDSARVRIQYEFNHQPVEEWLAIVQSSTKSTSTVALAETTNTIQSQAWVAAGRAPRGKLETEEKIRKPIFQSLTPDPAWTARQNDYTLRQMQAQQAQMQRQNQEFLERNRRVFENSMNQARQMENARHRGAMDTIDHIRDEQTMTNPATGQTGKVSNQYNYSYVDENGRVVQTNSPTFNPNAQFRGNWTQLQPTRR